MQVHEPYARPICSFFLCYQQSKQHKLNLSCTIFATVVFVASQNFGPHPSDKVLLMRPSVVPQNLKRRILKDALRKNESRDDAFRRIIRSVPKGKVSTYGKVAAAAGYPLYHRAVAKLLRGATLHGLPWQRIVGAGGEIKLRGEAAAEQRLRLGIEGVKFRGKRVNMELYEHTLRSWDTFE
jgi:methylated-DNA-protein-cysteine methyltransferase related protein